MKSYQINKIADLEAEKLILLNQNIRNIERLKVIEEELIEAWSYDRKLCECGCELTYDTVSTINRDGHTYAVEHDPYDAIDLLEEKLFERADQDKGDK